MCHGVYLEKKIRVLLLQAFSRCSVLAVKAAPLKSIKLFVCGRLNKPACIYRNEDPLAKIMCVLGKCPRLPVKTAGTALVIEILLAVFFPPHRSPYSRNTGKRAADRARHRNRDALSYFSVCFQISPAYGGSPSTVNLFLPQSN